MYGNYHSWFYFDKNWESCDFADTVNSCYNGCRLQDHELNCSLRYFNLSGASIRWELTVRIIIIMLVN